MGFRGAPHIIDAGHVKVRTVGQGWTLFHFRNCSRCAGGAEVRVRVGGHKAMSFSTASWMGDLSAFVSGRTLHELRIPGSHNSGSDVLRDGVAPGEPLVYAAVPCIIRGWSECQVECVSEQLRAGCRYIDLRTAAVKGKRGLRIVHGLVGCPVLDVLEQVSAFLAASPQEIVILDFQHFYEVSQAQQASLLGQCLELFSAAGCIQPNKV